MVRRRAKCCGQPPLRSPEIQRINLDFDGVLSQQVVRSKAELEGKFKAIAAMQDQSEIHLRSHAKASYKYVASVMASAQRLGAVKIGLVGNEQFMN
jgi:biopolymer transport protein ExbD